VAITPGEPEPLPAPQPPPPPRPPSNEFAIGGLTLNKHRGTAALAVEVPGPGTLTLAGPGLLTTGPVAFAAPGEVKLGVSATGRVKRRLRRSGTVIANATVSYIPSGGAANSKVAGVQLVKRRRS
jgi:hypothetical protein